MKAQNTVLTAIVGNGTVRQNETQAQFLAGATEGQVAVVSGDGLARAANKPFKVMSRKKGKVVQSEIIDPKHIFKAYANKAVAATEKSVAFGYNGTAGSIQVINSNLYQIMIELLEFGSQSVANRYLRSAQVNTTTGNTQAFIADGLVSSFVRNFSREPKRLIAERLTAATRSAATATAAVTLTFTEGSKIVRASASTASTNVVAGDYISIAAATTTPVYKVVAKDASGNLTLDVEYQRATTVVTANAANIRIAASEVAAANFGIRVTAVAQPFRAGFLQFRPIDFYHNLYNFGTTTVTELSVASKGQGDGREVAEIEWFVEGNDGELNRVGPNNYLYQSDFVAEPGSTYHAVTLHYRQRDEANALINPESPRSIVIFIKEAIGTFTEVNKLIADINAVSTGLLPTLS